MKVSAHKVNIRTIRNMSSDAPLALKNGKRVEYKTGYNVISAYTSIPVWEAHEIMEHIKAYNEDLSDFAKRHRLMLITKDAINGLYSFQLATHFSARKEAEEYIGKDTDAFIVVGI